MKNSFIRLLLRDIKNYIRTNRFFLIAEAALFLIGCMIADMQKPDSYGKYTTIQYYIQIVAVCRKLLQNFSVIIGWARVNYNAHQCQPDILFSTHPGCRRILLQL